MLRYAYWDADDVHYDPPLRGRVARQPGWGADRVAVGGRHLRWLPNPGHAWRCLSVGARVYSPRFYCSCGGTLEFWETGAVATSGRTARSGGRERGQAEVRMHVGARGSDDPRSTRR
jgi:hypothetical protein